MPDAPDWYNYRPSSSRHVLGDIGELAARLGSPDVYDRQGDVLWYDRFQHGASAWLAVVGGTGAELKPSADNTFWPGFCLKAVTPSNGANQVYMQHFLPCLDTERVGLEVSLNPETLCKYFQLDIYYDNTDISYLGRLRIDVENNELQVLDEAGAYQAFVTGLEPFYGTAIYTTFKMVIDLKEGTYARVMRNQSTYDVSDYQLYPNAPGATPYLEVELWLRGTSGENDVVNLGHVIVTAAEP